MSASAATPSGFSPLANPHDVVSDAAVSFIGCLAMFTGLVEGCGTVVDIQSQGASIRLTIDAPDHMCASGSVIAIGDSVAINGCCLTVIEANGPRWAFEAGSETLAKTNLGTLKSGDPANLERSLPVDGRLGGHFVQGHIDCVGHVDVIDRDGEWIDMWFRVPAAFARQMVPKGSVAVDGVSLTLVNVETDRFNVALIPHTLDVTTLGKRNEGDPVNIETDIIGKYVEKLLAGFQPTESKAES